MTLHMEKNNDALRNMLELKITSVRLQCIQLRYKNNSFTFLGCIYLFVCVYVCVLVWLCYGVHVEGRGQLAGMGSFLLPSGPQD